MFDNATLSIWLSDAALLGMAYFLGRIHASIRIRGDYTRQLGLLLAEVRTMRGQVDRLNDLYVAAQTELRELKGR